jgi:hypothetical protein
MARIPSAIEQQRRKATRRSWTGSGAKSTLARSHSRMTRRIQKARLGFSFARFGGGLGVGKQSLLMSV